MFFGKIDYLNLLPFHVFLKKYPFQSAIKKSIEFKKGVPSKLCRDLAQKRVNSAIISSVESNKKKYKILKMGIVSKKSVKSVLVRKNSELKLDPASKTSNVLSQILNLRGEVIIGDRALKVFLDEGHQKFYDLGEIWYKKYNLPFVFAKFCYTKNGEIYEKIVNKFLQSKIKIPNYILKKYAKTRQISEKNILWYLNFISYKIGKKEEKSFKIYINKAKELHFK